MFKIYPWITLFTLLTLSNAGNSAVITVNSASAIDPIQDDGFCTLQEAVIASNSNLTSGSTAGECVAGEPSPVIDTIQFELSLLPATVVIETPLQIVESMHIEGPHKDLLTLAGIGIDRVIEFSTIPNQNHTLSDLTITGGYAGVGPVPDSSGGAMMVSLSNSSLLIERVRFTNNYAEYSGGAITIGYGGTTNNHITISQSEFYDNASSGSVEQANGNTGGGGAIFIGAYQNVVIQQSTFVNNQAQNITAPLPSGDGIGGAIWMLSSAPAAVSSLTIDSSTFDGNLAHGAGGAIAVGGPGFPDDYSLVNIKHNTITGNTADANMSDTGSAGGGIFSTANDPVNLFNNVIARNLDHSTTSRPNLSGVFNSFGHNYTNGNPGISSDFPIGMPNANNDLVAPAIGLPDLAVIDDNGGPTLTRAIEAGSPLIDQGKCSNAVTDQRGFNHELNGIRIIDDNSVADLADGCDIGAYELDAINQNPMPTAADDQYTVLEDHVLVLSDPDGQTTPGDDNDNTLLWNDVDDDNLWVLNAGALVPDSNDMLDPGLVELLADGSLSYTPATDSHGVTFFDYTVSDRYNHGTAQAVIEVLAVNDAPTFTQSGAGVFSFTNITQSINYEDWATDIDAGAANEAHQGLLFDITFQSGDASFFSQQPNINAQTGTFSFEVSNQAEGTVELLIQLIDNGGTDNGGVDTSAPVTVTISRSISDVIFQNSFELPQGS